MNNLFSRWNEKSLYEVAHIDYATKCKSDKPGNLGVNCSPALEMQIIKSNIKIITHKETIFYFNFRHF